VSLSITGLGVELAQNSPKLFLVTPAHCFHKGPIPQSTPAKPLFSKQAGERHPANTEPDQSNVKYQLYLCDFEHVATLLKKLSHHKKIIRSNYRTVLGIQ
jgi:hypothetical protein